MFNLPSIIKEWKISNKQVSRLTSVYLLGFNNGPINSQDKRWHVHDSNIPQVRFMLS